MHIEDTEPHSRYKAFIQKVVEQDEVWALEGSEGLAISSSSANEEQDAIPFWSGEELAAAVAADDWAGFKPVPMSLAEFLENWLTVMHNDEMLVGLDWDAELAGKEEEPMILALALATEAIAGGKDLEFANYKNAQDFVQQIREATNL